MKLAGLFVFFFCVFAFLPRVAANGHHQVVLITNTSCPINTISSLELRKIYFGYNVRRDNVQIWGLLNLSDTQLNEIFHQIVVTMSSKSYRRRLLAQTLNIGSSPVAEFSDRELLLTELRKKPCNVTYIWKHEANHFDDLKVIKLLWTKN